MEEEGRVLDDAQQRLVAYSKSLEQASNVLIAFVETLSATDHIIEIEIETQPSLFVPSDAYPHGRLIRQHHYCYVLLLEIGTNRWKEFKDCMLTYKYALCELFFSRLLELELSRCRIADVQYYQSAKSKDLSIHFMVTPKNAKMQGVEMGFGYVDVVSRLPK